ncbi:hypothetical protein AQPE_4522 [Aquipluma nitroreducens]|uniref:Uncharacterized protein n=1 Tax=Aquipluma nitroreducens TaxID=2010828 RepID=A0A5K7SFG0_9BACT|nr:hypothetical protein [Aquipluma nitroreducens]BBE20331.1 hypothetical protein AQPE_4522 [Aquipluma nitroreducens]
MKKKNPFAIAGKGVKQKFISTFDVNSALRIAFFLTYPDQQNMNL